MKVGGGVPPDCIVEIVDLRTGNVVVPAPVTPVWQGTGRPVRSVPVVEFEVEPRALEGALRTVNFEVRDARQVESGDAPVVAPLDALEDLKAREDLRGPGGPIRAAGGSAGSVGGSSTAKAVSQTCRAYRTRASNSFACYAR